VLFFSFGKQFQAVIKATIALDLAIGADFGTFLQRHFLVVVSECRERNQRG